MIKFFSPDRFPEKRLLFFTSVMLLGTVFNVSPVFTAYVRLLFSLANEAVIPVNIDRTSLVIVLHHHSFSIYINNFLIYLKTRQLLE